MAIYIRRREFIVTGGGAVAWSIAAQAQQRFARVRRIAWLGIGRADEPSPYVDSLRAGMRELGWIEGSNLTIGLDGQQFVVTWGQGQVEARIVERRRPQSSRWSTTGHCAGGNGRLTCPKRAARCHVRG